MEWKCPKCGEVDEYIKIGLKYKCMKCEKEFEEDYE
ncbi:hypothetical protein LCGC14_2007140 [marine sediment metagenome]|uniref:Uncharacterized protein n=1 Tax=marine sediment metagenome TaxID=412755 RepID=A0A0F9HET1_9ZZZZ